MHPNWVYKLYIFPFWIVNTEMCLEPKNSDIIRIFHGYEVRIEKSIRVLLFGTTRLCRVMPNSDPKCQDFSVRTKQPW